MSDMQLIQDFFDVFKHRNLTKMDGMLTKKAEFYFPKTQPLIGEERILKFISDFFKDTEKF